MAGIGFRLQKLLVEEMYLSIFQGFFYSLIITSGPWLIMVVSLEVLSLFSTFLIPIADRQFFKILLVHVYVLTILESGFYQLYFTRIFADKLYMKERESLPDVIGTHLALSLMTLAALVLPFLALIDAAFVVKALSFSLFMAMGMMWVLLNYVSASDEFLAFMRHFLIGSAVSLGLGSGLGYTWDFAGMLLGFTAGQIYIALALLSKTIEVFGVPRRFDWSLLARFRQYRMLFASGFFLYAGMWVDKLIFWYSPYGRRLQTILYYHPRYNDVFYIAFLFATPVMAIFFLSMETVFYRAYYAYNTAVMSKGAAGGLQRLREFREKIKASIWHSLQQIIRIQALIIVIGILFSRRILAFLNMPPDLDALLNIVLIGVLFHMLTLITCVILLYFDLRRETMRIYAAFFLVNGLLTWLLLQLGEQYAGLGYAAAAMLVFAGAIWQLRYYLNNITYLTFTRQEMPHDYAVERELRCPDTGLYGRYYLKDGTTLIHTG